MIYSKYCLIVLALALFSCNDSNKKSENVQVEAAKADEIKSVSQKVDGHNSNNSLDWEGVYQGTLPCADCEGIKTTITLLKDNTYKMATKYLGKSDKDIHEKGTFSWDASGGIITINNDASQRQYKVGENVLFHLDNDGNQITGDLADKYKLMKNYSDFNLENKKWVLTKLMGQDIEDSKDAKTAFVMFNAKEAVVSGNNGCNLFSGGYTLESGNRIKIGNMMNTMMACDNMDQATQFMGVLQKADNYTVVDGVLNLNKARMAPLASFKLVDAN